MTVERARRGGLGVDLRALCEEDAPERVAISWAAAGAALAGGLWPVVLLSTGRTASATLVDTSLRLFLAGAVVGFLHGTVLGWLARRPGGGGASLARTVVNGAWWSIVACLVAWTPAFWMALSEPVRSQGGVGARIGVGMGWLLGAGVVLWAVAEGVRAVGRVYERWPERDAGTSLIAVTFCALVLLLLAAPPSLPGIEGRLGAAGAVLVAGGLTIWVAAPLVAYALHRVSSGRGAR